MISYEKSKRQLIERINNEENSKKANQTFQLHTMIVLHVFFHTILVHRGYKHRERLLREFLKRCKDRGFDHNFIGRFRPILRRQNGPFSIVFHRVMFKNRLAGGKDNCSKTTRSFMNYSFYPSAIIISKDCNEVEL